MWLFGRQFSHKGHCCFFFISAEQLAAQFASTENFPEYL